MDNTTLMSEQSSGVAAKFAEPEVLAKGITLRPGDCMAVLAALDADSVDSCVTDPPYHLTSIVKRFGQENSAPVKIKKIDGQGGSPFARGAKGFMGKQWDGGEIAFEPETWAAVYRVLKLGGHLVAFGAPKNFGFMQYAISQAGFEIRDVLAWLFGSGFPKSHNQPGGFGTALKPAYEPIIMARKPLTGTVAANMAEHGTGALNIDGCRVDGAPRQTHADGSYFTGKTGLYENGHEAKKLSVPEGRWPANVIHDGSDAVLEHFPDAPGQQYSTGPQYDRKAEVYGKFAGVTAHEPRGDSGSAARFFYTAKADADDRLGSKHPTVKPLDLMQWLVRLVTPPGGLVLDPFAGTGTTGEAAFREGMRAVLIEREPEYQNDIRRRMSLVLGGPEERQRESIKARGLTADAGPLFGGSDTTRGGGADRFTGTSPIRTNDRTNGIEMVKP